MIKTHYIGYGKFECTIRNHFFPFLKIFIFLKLNVESQTGKNKFFQKVKKKYSI